MVPEPRGLLLRRYARGTFPWGQGKAGHMGTRDGVQPPEGKVGSSAPCWNLPLPKRPQHRFGPGTRMEARFLQRVKSGHAEGS